MVAIRIRPIALYKNVKDKKYNLNIIPVYIERLKDNNFKVEFQSAIKHSDFADKTDLSIKLNKVLEEMILRNPGQWIWSHNRWK